MSQLDIPLLVICISGKRKAGKDYISGRILSLFTELNIASEIYRISEPLKRQFADMHNLDVVQLLSDSSYKELHRPEMVEWSEQIRSANADYFCQFTLEKCERNVCIISDCRRPSDLHFFRRNFPISLFVRVVCSENVRKNRQYQFVVGIDDADTECALDSFDSWDFVLENDGDEARLTCKLASLAHTVEMLLAKGAHG